MKVHSLFSSSSGNCMKIFTDKATIIIDAGVSYKRVCEANGEPLHDLNALFITHDHGDHVGGAGVMGRKTGAPIYIHEKSYKAREKLFKDCDINFIEPGQSIVIEDLEVIPFSNKHDAQYCVSYVVKDLTTGKKFGYTTDTGMFTPLMKNYLKDCDAYLLEANYDVQMMEDYDEYDQIHKDRVTSPVGHLSNDQCVEFIDNNVDLDKVQFILLGHLSPRTNCPKLIEKQFMNKLGSFEKFHFAPSEEFFVLD